MRTPRPENFNPVCQVYGGAVRAALGIIFAREGVGEKPETVANGKSVFGAFGKLCGDAAEDRIRPNFPVGTRLRRKIRLRHFADDFGDFRAAAVSEPFDDFQCRRQNRHRVFGRFYPNRRRVRPAQEVGGRAHIRGNCRLANIVQIRKKILRRPIGCKILCGKIRISADVGKRPEVARLYKRAESGKQPAQRRIREVVAARKFGAHPQFFELRLEHRSRRNLLARDFQNIRRVRPVRLCKSRGKLCLVRSRLANKNVFVGYFGAYFQIFGVRNSVFVETIFARRVVEYHNFEPPAEGIGKTPENPRRIENRGGDIRPVRFGEIRKNIQ